MKPKHLPKKNLKPKQRPENPPKLNPPPQKKKNSTPKQNGPRPSRGFLALRGAACAQFAAAHPGPGAVATVQRGELGKSGKTRKKPVICWVSICFKCFNLEMIDLASGFGGFIFSSRVLRCLPESGRLSRKDQTPPKNIQTCGPTSTVAKKDFKHHPQFAFLQNGSKATMKKTTKASPHSKKWKTKSPHPAKTPSKTQTSTMKIK